MRRFLAALLLPLVLLCTQQAALQHEIRQHLASVAGSSDQQHPTHGDRCDLCLGFSQMATAIGGDVVSLGLLSDLAFHHLPLQAPSSATRELTTPRSRGPPLL